MTLEEDLRTILREHAGEPALRPDLLDRVHGGLRRSNRRRAAVLGAAVLLVTAAGVPVALTGRAAPPLPDPVGSAPPGWHRPRIDPPVFPLTPAWTPPGTGPAFAGRVGSRLLLMYEHGSRSHLEVEVGPEPGDWWAEADGDDVTTSVGGSTAKVRTVPAGVYEGLRPGDGYVGVRWRLADGRWVQVGSGGRATVAEVLRFARGLELRSGPVARLPFTIAAAPPGLGLQELTEDGLCLAPPALLDDRDGGRGICVSLVPAAEAEAPDPGDERLTVGGRAATLADGENDRTVTIALGAGRQLKVDVARADLPLTGAELVRFAEGVGVR